MFSNTWLRRRFFSPHLVPHLGCRKTALAAFDERPVTYDPAEIARAGVFVSIDADGGLRIERGYVRREDEAPVETADGGTETGTDPAVADERPVAVMATSGPGGGISWAGPSRSVTPRAECRSSRMDRA